MSISFEKLYELLVDNGIEHDKAQEIVSKEEENFYVNSQEELENEMDSKASIYYEDAVYGYDGDFNPSTGMSDYDFNPGISYNDAGEPKGYM